MKVFLDTNVIIDVLAAREPFFRDSQRVVDYCERHPACEVESQIVAYKRGGFCYTICVP